MYLFFNFIHLFISKSCFILHCWKLWNVFKLPFNFWYGSWCKKPQKNHITQLWGKPVLVLFLMQTNCQIELVAAATSISVFTNKFCIYIGNNLKATKFDTSFEYILHLCLLCATSHKIVQTDIMKCFEFIYYWGHVILLGLNHDVLSDSSW